MMKKIIPLFTTLLLHLLPVPDHHGNRAGDL